MLYLSLIGAGILLVLSNVIVHFNRTNRGAQGTVMAAVCASPFATICMMFALPPVLLQGIGLFLVWVVWAAFGGRPKSYMVASVAVTVLAFAYVFVTSTLPQMNRERALKQQYPIESMADRVAPPKPSERAGSLRPEILAALEVEPYEHRGYRGETRASRLKELHENTVGAFVNSMGFGVSRMRPPSDVDLPVEPIGPIPQPGQRDSSTGDVGVVEVVALSPSRTPLSDFHRSRVDDFIFPQGYGYERNRNEVAGFLGHRMTKVPTNPIRWNLQTLDLMGLVVHPEPVVYTSEHLPRMDELRGAATRALDDFEAAGLAELRKGEELVAQESATRMRLLGAIRSGRDCTTCHGCNKGDLLGAFSYALTANR